MNWVSKLVADLQEKLDLSLENAKALNQAVSGDIYSENFKELQSQQSEILSQLIEADKKLCEEYGRKWYAQRPLSHLQIKDKIRTIQKLNEDFVGNLKVRKGLLGIELQELNKTKRTFSQVKTHYGKPEKKQKKLRINVFS